MNRWRRIALLIAITSAVAGCPRGRTDFNLGHKAEDLQDYDAAVEYYRKALISDPDNASYQIKFNQARFEAAEVHVKNGLKLRERGDLENAASEFQRAALIDPSSVVAEQELRKIADMIAQNTRDRAAASEPALDNGEDLASSPPEIRPLSRSPINLKMSNDAKIVFDTIGKLAGITAVFDVDFPARRISVDLNDVTLEQALDVVCIESKAFFKPITENIILVIPDQPQKRRDYEEEVMRTFFLSNTVQPQDLTEIVTGLRQLLDLKRIQQLNSQNAIVIRATPDQVALAGKFIENIDKAKPEVVVQVSVLEARVDKTRDLGILPPQTASISIVPPGSTSSNNSNSSNGTSTGTNTNSTNGVLTLQNLGHINSSDTSVTVPTFTLNALLSDAATRVIQNPEVRSIDGQPAKLNIGDRVPVATGSFQAGVGVGGSAGTGFVNPLVNTQFQYIDVGVNVELTPRVHPNREVSLKLQLEVSSTSNFAMIGGIQQPIISQRKIAHEIRLKEGESSILAGLITKSDMKNLSGWPGLTHVPILRYLFSEDKRQFDDDEILMILTPHIVRMPQWTKSDLRALYTGSETNVQVKHESELRAPQQPAAIGPADLGANAQTQSVNPSAQLHFDPQSFSLKAGQTTTVGVVVNNVKDLFSIPFLIRYNPAVISIEDVQYGDFLQAGDQEVALVLQVDKEQGEAALSAGRQPNTPGVSGSGTIMGIVVRGIAPGTSSLSIMRANARDSRQAPIQLVTTEARIQVGQ